MTLTRLKRRFLVMWIALFYKQVQVKRVNCGNSTCTCAIVVQEGNSAVQIDVCDQKQIIPIIKYLSAVSESEITVEQSNNGLQFHVSRPSDIYTGSVLPHKIYSFNIKNSKVKHGWIYSPIRQLSECERFFIPKDLVDSSLIGRLKIWPLA